MSKPESVQLRGRSGKKGQPFIFDTEQMKEFLLKWPDTPLIIEITVQPPNATGNQIGYYKKVILPKLVEGWERIGERFTKEQADIKIRELSPFCEKEEDGLKIILPVERLNKNQMRGHIEFCIQTAAEMLNVFIPNPKF